MRAAMIGLVGAVACADPRQAENVAPLPAPLVWDGEQKLTAGDAAEFDQLGYSVSLADDRALLGAYGESAYRGAAYVFTGSGSALAEEQKLVASDGAEGDSFGWSVALDGDRALFGAYGVESYRGAAYVFVRNGSSFVEEQKLVADDGSEGDNFGWSVALSGDRALIGAFADDTSSGAAYVFVRRDGTWTEEQKLVASDRVESDQFGFAVSLVGERALVGAPGNEDDRGAAFLFVHDGDSFTEQQKLVASDGASVSGGGIYPGDHFGASLSLAAERALVGAHYKEALSGAAYVFVESDGSFTEEQKLVASDGATGSRFGNAISLGPDRALLGAFSNEAARGAAYVFVRDGSTWTGEQKLVASDGIEADLFGWSVALAGDRALIGAPSIENLRGAAYAFSLGFENGENCSDDTDCASGHCADERCCNTDCSGPCGACSIAAGAEADGTCAVVPRGAEGSPSCGDLACNGQSAECSPCESDEDCPLERHCAADQTCRPQGELGEACEAGAGTACRSGFCADGVCCERECTAAEACAAALKVSGDDGSCGEAKAAVNGSFCTGGESCTSGHCVDGVCCDAPCDGSCEACTQALKGDGADGTCGYVAAGLNPRRSAADPSPDCTDDGACSGALSCDGSGACACVVSLPPADDPGDGDGCGCRANGSARHSSSDWLSVALGLLFLYRRRSSMR